MALDQSLLPVALSPLKKGAGEQISRRGKLNHASKNGKNNLLYAAITLACVMDFESQNSKWNLSSGVCDGVYNYRRK